jgi:hypothetical protein
LGDDRRRDPEGCGPGKKAPLNGAPAQLPDRALDDCFNDRLTKQPGFNSGLRSALLLRYSTQR